MAEYQLKAGKFEKKVVDGYKKIEEKFTDTFLEKESNRVRTENRLNSRESNLCISQNRRWCGWHIQKDRACICR